MDYDFDALTDNQHKCLAYHAMDGQHFDLQVWQQSTLDSLVARGLLTREDRPHGSGLTVHWYEMPWAVHIAWCEWCDKELAKEGVESDGN